VSTDVLIIGGGLAGLACALGLGGKGLRITLVERSERLGGRAGSCTDPKTGDAVDVGPHVLLTEYPNLLRLLELLGTRDHVVWDQDRLMTLVEQGRAIEIRSSLLPAPFHLLPSLLRVPTVSTRDLLSNHHTSWFVMRASEEDLLRLDSVDALTFLHRMKVTERFIDWFWATICIAIMNVPLDQCSTAALLRFYRIVLAHANLHLGFADVGLAELFGPPATRRIEADGGQVMVGTEVKALTRVNGAVAGVVLADGRRIEAGTCVCAVAPGDLAAFLPSDLLASGAPFTELASFRPSPYVSSYLWFDRKVTRARNWARTWSPDNLNCDFYDLSNIRRGWQDRPSVIAGNIIFSYRAQHLSDAEIVDATVREIAEFAPSAAGATVRHARVHRIPMAIPCPHPGVEGKRPSVSTRVPGLYLAGDWVKTGLPASMESAVRAGWLAAEQVLERAGRGCRLALDVEKTRGILALTTGGAGSEAKRRARDGAPMA
jgi:15-cis-phytoene desaturase